jgi:tetratricopeptide (TPR) repeat protein
LDKTDAFLRRGLELAADLGDRDSLALLTARRALSLLMQLKSAEADEVLVPAVSEFTDVSAYPLAQLQLARARVLYAQTEYRKCLEVLEPLLESAERNGFTTVVADALMQRGISLLAVGRRREAWGVVRASRDLGEELGNTNIVLRAVGNIANILTELDLTESLSVSREQLTLARKAGQRGPLLFGAGNFVYTAFLTGEWDAAIEMLEEHLDADMPSRERLLLLNNGLIVRASRGEAIDEGLAEMERLGKEMSGHWHFYVADPSANRALARSDAKAAAEHFLEIAQDDEGTANEYYYRAARPQAWLGDVDKVREYSKRVEAFGGYGPVFAGRRQSLAANVSALEGRTAEALALYRESLRNFKSAKAVYDEAMVGLDMAKLLDPAESEVAAVIESTRQIFERLGAKPYLEQLAAAAERPTATRAAKAKATAEVAAS